MSNPQEQFANILGAHFRKLADDMNRQTTDQATEVAKSFSNTLRIVGNGLVDLGQSLQDAANEIEAAIQNTGGGN